MAKSTAPAFRQQLESLYSISIEIAQLHELPPVLDRALGHCLGLTASDFGFIGLLNASNQLDVAAIKGFQPSDPKFYERFRLIPVRPSVFGVVITEGHSNISNDVLHDPGRVGQPKGHPPVRTFLGVPLQVGEKVVGMIGVANKPGGYTADDERFLSTFANQVAVAVENARLYESQREMIGRLEQLHQELNQAEREQVRLQERERIAADVHDQIGQAIFTIGMKVNGILEREDVAPAIVQRLEEVSRLAGTSAENVREVIFQLTPPPIGQGSGSLVASLRKLVRSAGRTYNLETDLVVGGREARLGTEIERILQAVVKEAISNVARHARAKMVLVTLSFLGGSVDVVIQDDGDGASELILRNYQESSTHFGLKGLGKMVTGAGGRFEVGNGEESGLVVKARFPFVVEKPA
jgi:signal transduction histidine kinase